jgi:hypothetical protein
LQAVADAYNCGPEDLILKMLSISPDEIKPKEEEPAEITGKAKRDPAQRHGSLLAQSMLQLPGEFHRIISER